MSDRAAGAPGSTGEKRCAKCGACTAVCPVYRASGNEIYSARGKRHLAEVFADRRPSPVFEDIYSKCLLCGACSAACPRQLDITEDVMEARSGFSPFYGEHGYQKFLARQALNRPELLGAARVLGRRAAALLFGRLPADSGLRLRLALFASQAEAQTTEAAELPRKPPPETGSAITYFPGCAARYLYPEVMETVASLLEKLGSALHTPSGLGCCGLATRAAGHPDEAKRLARRNIRVLERSDGPILVSCGSCFAQLAAYGQLLADDADWHQRAVLIGERAVELSVMLENLLETEEAGEAAGGAKLRVFYHDPCHLRHEAEITAEPRAVLQRLPGVELMELPDGPQCCGQGGLFHLGAPELSAVIRDDLADKIIALEPDVITTTCSGCLMQLRSAMAARQSAIPVIHLAAVLGARQSAEKKAAIS